MNQCYFLFNYVRFHIESATWEDINEAFKKLYPPYQELLIKVYGDTLDGKPKYNELSKNEKIKLNNAKSRLIAILNKKVKKQYLFDYVKMHISNITWEQINTAFERLCPSNKEILIKVYGEDLKENANTTGLSQHEKIILNTAKTRLITILKSKKRLIDYIRKYVEDITWEDINKAFELLNPKYKNIMMAVYGDSLQENSKYNKLNNQEKKELINARNRLLSIIQKQKMKKPKANHEDKIQRRMQQIRQIVKQEESLYTILSMYNKQYIDTVISTLSLSFQEKIVFFFGFDYENNRKNLTPKEKHTKDAIIIILKLLLIETPSFSDNTYNEWRKLAIYFNNQECKEYISTLPPHEQIIIKAKLGFWDGRIYSIKDISLATEFDEETINLIIKNVLMALREIIANQKNNSHFKSFKWKN